MIKIKYNLTSTIVFMMFIGYCTASFAQENWRLQLSLNSNKGNYINSTLIDKQSGEGIKADIDNANWGGALGFQSTRIDMQAITALPQSTQENWLFSVRKKQPLPFLSGLITYKLDSHHINGNRTQQSDIHALAPEISWSSYEKPIAIGVSTANSSYPGMPSIHQFDAYLRYGLNDIKSWIEIRESRITNLDPSKSEQRKNTLSQELRITHFFTPQSFLLPISITIGIDRGEKIYYLDMLSQSAYNLPMLNNGGHSITGMWHLNSNINFKIHINQTKYTSTQNGQSNDFNLKNMSVITTFNW
jgi:hypothetical protein